MRGWLDRVSWIGPVAFFLAACAWSMLDAEYASDTWIGLAAGRHIMEQLDWSRFHETFPRTDPFSYTFHGQPWFNQNWLSNLVYYWAYVRLGPSSVIYGTWVMVLCIHALVLLAVYWRTHSWLAAWLAAAVAAIGGRDFLEPRAATIGLLCTAALWALVCAIEGQGERRRWWPIVPILPLLWFWANAHGGFVFGYGLLALYCGCWVVARLFGKFRLAASGPQILSIAVVLTVAFSITILAGPFGIERFTHVGKVASDTPFRLVSEFIPAYLYVGDLYPPMWRFWWLVGLTTGAIVVFWLARRIGAPSRAPDNPSRGHAPTVSLFDIAIVIACLAMTLWGRRFAPLFYMVSAPVLASLFIRLAGPFVPRLRGNRARALGAVAALAAVATASLTLVAVKRELIDPYRDEPATGLLDRARGDRLVHEAVRFLAENRLRINLLTTYGDAALVMFRAPLARVFMDPRGDQVYSAQHARKYVALMNPETSSRDLSAMLVSSGTDAVLVRRSARTAALRDMLGSPDWTLVFLNRVYFLFLRTDSVALREFGELIRAGRDWEATQAGVIAPNAQASRAMVLLNTLPRDPVGALDLLKKAVDRDAQLGQTFYLAIVDLQASVSGAGSAADYIRSQTARVASDHGLEAKTRSALLASLQESSKLLERANAGSTDRPGPTK